MDQQSLYKTEAGKAAVLEIYHQLLNKITVPYEELFLNTRYGKTYVIASGSVTSPPLILLHGSGSNATMWVGDISHYSKSYRVYALDIPGDPGKSEDIRHPLKSDAYAEWMNDVLRALHLEQATLIGISLGAWMAVNYAVKHPEKVDKLVLMSPSGIGPQRASFLFKAMPFLLMGEKGRDKVSRLVNGIVELPEQSMQNTKIIARHFRFRSETVPIFTDQELGHLKMPVLLIAGERDVMLHSRKTAERLSSLLPHANIQLLPEYGHVLIRQTPRILPFLSGNSK
ncbi:alpha/beta fold hydrolase [Paenibacillus agri]|uniref:Alpha/beta hydrolase n=1 Tax=Paenibacillus agri TaxID=2744309 RepID=A0A850EVE9_9BACL|nr:alpha/beta hydrolase [Paenibacillus agri]NUU61861.1 alpha/beta hydrolase [Paenibacillus agri]